MAREYKIWINTTPLGMYPNTGEAPPMPYPCAGKQHLLFDLIYNPAETLFLRHGREQGATVINGQEMLELQAEKAWEIWNNP
jgi:shikimate dehydrogenase